MDADAILQTPTNAPAAILGTSEAEIAAAFRRLAAEWHPDHNKDPRATAVLQHLTALRADAKRRMRGTAAPDGRTFRSADGRTFRVRNLSAAGIDVGEVLVSATALVYRFEAGNGDIADAEAAAVRGLSFAGDGMRREMARFLPDLVRDVALEDGGRLLVYRKTPDQFLLSDMLRSLGRIDPLHVAWIVSGMENLACYLAWAGISHGAVSPENLLVSPEHHSVALVGGFGFSARLGRAPIALPGRTASLLPAAAMAAAPAVAGTDLELVRATGRECLGDPGGGRLLSDPSVPAAMSRWLALPAKGDAAADYASWEAALTAAYGPRRFVPMKVSPGDVYAA